jgi:hypothetical protein
MENEYFKKQLETLSRLQDQANDKRESFFQQILIAASSIIAILVALHDVDKSEHLYIRPVFVLAVSLFLLGILSTASALYKFAKLREKAFQLFLLEIETAKRENRELKPVFAGNRKKILLHEKFSLILLIISLIALVVYTGLTTLL